MTTGIVVATESGVTIDVEAVGPGSYIGPEELEQAIGASRHEARYSWEILRLRSQLEADLAEA